MRKLQHSVSESVKAERLQTLDFNYKKIAQRRGGQKTKQKTSKSHTKHPGEIIWLSEMSQSIISIVKLARKVPWKRVRCS